MVGYIVDFDEAQVRFLAGPSFAKAKNGYILKILIRPLFSASFFN